MIPEFQPFPTLQLLAVPRANTLMEIGFITAVVLATNLREFLKSNVNVASGQDTSSFVNVRYMYFKSVVYFTAIRFQLNDYVA